jgi:hypothetical protein
MENEEGQRSEGRKRKISGQRNRRKFFDFLP